MSNVMSLRGRTCSYGVTKILSATDSRLVCWPYLYTGEGWGHCPHLVMPSGTWDRDTVQDNPSADCMNQLSLFKFRGHAMEIFLKLYKSQIRI